MCICDAPYAAYYFFCIVIKIICTVMLQYEVILWYCFEIFYQVSFAGYYGVCQVVEAPRFSQASQSKHLSIILQNDWNWKNAAIHFNPHPSAREEINIPGKYVTISKDTEQNQPEPVTDTNATAAHSCYYFWNRKIHH